ncbi:MAG: type II secretion protein F [Candidatus Wallbacteria bacterium HGW-Wallbacteria-1]|jgi:tight adherence protein B|uniref:Type II secretion protein F n=1 Tax=Candidatus Wallbacteria bacterium HGW-Wallbacteria-1 TaxID=2013854 RepID=A0A2N1PQ49_9BACT|nr:MAG: type II secretion protein F [Candidatus Wallbacteria bacterium HGW-Wallbacteria-1]
MGIVEILVIGIASVVFCYAILELVADQYESFKQKKSFAMTVIEEIGLTINQFVVINFLAIVLAGLLGLFVFDFITMISVKIILVIYCCFIGYSIPQLLLKGLYAKRSKLFEEQLVGALLMLSSALKSGRNLEQALEMVEKGMPSPICDEFRWVLQERKLGVSMEQALSNLGDRIESEDLNLVITAILFQKETGGNLIELFKQIIYTVDERKRVQGKLNVLTAHVRFEGYVIGALPFVLILLMAMFAPSYMKVFIVDKAGQALIAAILILQLIGVAAMRKIISIRI